MLPTELTFIVITAIVAALIAVGAVVAMLRGGRRADEPSRPVERAVDLPTKYEAAEAPSRAAPMLGSEGHAAYDGVLRVLWWLTISVVLVGAGLSNAFSRNQSLIFALGAAGVIAVVLLHELLPARWRSPLTSGLEALIAIGLVGGLLIATGYGSSPFFFAFVIVAVAVALGHGGRAAFLVAALATLAYLGVLTLDPASASYSGADLLRFGLNIGSVWLLAYLAGVFAAQERRVREWLRMLSLVDPLTGVFNRSQIYTELEQEVRRTRRSERGFCLLMIDLDGLKAVNDSMGHHRGDEVLHALGGVIRQSIRAVDTAYRYGGDEFLVLLPETDIAGAFVVAEKIRAGAEELGQAETDTSVSIGLVSHPEDGGSPDELVKAADLAMYQAKSLGKNQISGVPRVRRGAPRHLPGPVEAPRDAVAVAVPIRPETPEPTPVAPVASATPVASAVPPTSVLGNGVPDQRAAEATDEREPDPTDVRRQIARAQQSFDPDYQIRRAMDAFLSSPTHEEKRAPDA